MNHNVLARGGRSRIPLTIVGGPEGAGKTTLLRHLLTNNDGRRLAVLLDHPSSLGLHGSSIAKRFANSLELHNGSACLGLDGDIGPALQTMHATIDQASLPEHVVVEANSTASLVRMSGYAFLPGVRPGGMVSVLSAPAVAELREAGAEPDVSLAAQLQQAELLVLNQIEAVKPPLRPGVRRWVQQRTSRARVIEAEQCCIPAAMILGASLDRAPIHALHAEWSPSFSIETEAHHRQVRQPRHPHDYRAWLLTTRSTVDAAAFRTWATNLPDSIVRGDGVLRITGERSHRFQFHRCGSRWSLSRGEPWESTDEPVSWISLVGFAVASGSDARTLDRLEGVEPITLREPRHFRPPLRSTKDTRSIEELS